MKSLLITLVAPHSSPNPLLFHLNFSSFISPQPKISRIGPPPLYPHPPSIPPLVIVLIDHAIVLWWEHNFTLGHNIYPLILIIGCYQHYLLRDKFWNI